MCAQATHTLTDSSRALAHKQHV